MDVNHINPVLKSFSNILPQLVFGKIDKKGVSLKGSIIDSPGVIITIGLFGDLKGNIIYGMSEDTAKAIASKMMMGMPVDEFNELAQSAISELINMLTANTATNFSENGIIIDISTPTLMYGDFKASACSDQVLCVKMVVDDYEVDVNISIE
ncbi:chemotaxis protein CheX [Clostridium sp. DSM 8431]|uniref:chemotaxis protein CheX n=1 Tax=Clostridium sp. DSM 8431 TaxID=1761781 RepID=UPI0008ED0904|nr:chemotaxis protein CheX [Clostridium sp. DSM 8431]SFU32600.1 chemotaxis protein CheX [Clostridium sp. DSM 8431]